MREVKKSGWVLKEVEMGVNASINNVKMKMIWKNDIIQKIKLFGTTGERRTMEEKIKKYRAVCAEIFLECATESELNNVYDVLRDNMVCEMATRAEALEIDPDTL